MADSTIYFNDGAAYDRLMAPWSRAAGKEFLHWLAMPPGLRWLDVGCGTGAFTELVLEQCGPRDVSAVDPAEDQIAYARTKPAAKGASFRLGEAQALPFSDREFDVAAMALVITFVPDPAQAIAEMKRVVRPGGMLGTYVWDFLGKGNTQHPLREAVEAMGIPVLPTPGHDHSRLESLRAIFAGAGLDAVSARPIEIEISYANFDAYWTAQTGFANTVVQHMRKMTEAQIEELKAHLREHLPRDKSGRIVYKAWANAAKGRVPG
ncbi:MAG: methyltransferase domain-containing protein [Xanthobacteraceae bacterium]